MFERVFKTYSRLSFGECYGFVPAVALGGTPDLKHLKRLEAISHFAILAQAQKFTLMRIEQDGALKAVRPIG